MAVLKMNSLVDKRMARKLYDANKAGVRQDLLVRGMCVIKPGVPGLSGNINAFSIVEKIPNIPGFIFVATMAGLTIIFHHPTGCPGTWITVLRWLPRL